MLDWILENWTTIFTIIGLIATVCSTIVGLFGKCKWLSYVVKVCDYMSVFNTPENKEKIEKANESLKKAKNKK